jgi:hypothetical protein
MSEKDDINMDNWNDFSGEFLKANLIEEWPLIVAVKDIEALTINEKPVLNIIFEYLSRDKKLSLNKTNRNFLINSKLKSPKSIIGKKLTFDKIKVRNPQGESVDSFELVKVE